MSVPLYVPFINMPYSVSVQSSSYTIPAGYYARCTASLKGNSTFTIGGSTALYCSSNSVLASDNLITANGTGGNLNGALGTAALGAGQSNAVGSAFNEATDEKVMAKDYWLPSGTIINGTGTWAAVVELFLIPS